jgi:hypothetical protein
MLDKEKPIIQAPDKEREKIKPIPLPQPKPKEIPIIKPK